ncbi:MAG TPA: hypothetical protein DD434_04955 [Bacteroidales bacterium]|nr:hypothetical protein [Bacteroidales bacterium]
MKRVLVLFVLIFISFTAISQTKFGVRAGMTLSTYCSAQEDYLFKPGIHIGGVADIPLGSSNFSFLPGLYFADKGTKIKGDFPHSDIIFFVRPEAFNLKETHYNFQLEIPLLLAYKIPINEKVTLKPQIGVYFSYTMFGRINSKYNYYFSYDPNPPSEITEDYYFYNDFYLGLGGNIGLSAFYNKYSFTISCDAGFSNNEGTILSYEIENYPDICIYFSLGYNF